MRLLLLGAVFALSMHAATHYITIAGLGGEPDYDQRFTGWAQTIDQVLRTSRTDARIETLTGANATRDRIREARSMAKITNWRCQVPTSPRRNWRRC